MPVSLRREIPFVSLGEPKLRPARSPGSSLTPLSVRKLATGREFRTSASLRLLRSPACTADCAPRQALPEPISLRLRPETRSWLTAPHQSTDRKRDDSKRTTSPHQRAEVEPESQASTIVLMRMAGPPIWPQRSWRRAAAEGLFFVLDTAAPPGDCQSSIIKMRSAGAARCPTPYCRTTCYRTVVQPYRVNGTLERAQSHQR